MVITVRNNSCEKVMFSQASVILYKGEGEVYTPIGRHPPRWPLQWTVRILLECILVLLSGQVVLVSENRWKPFSSFWAILKFNILIDNNK